MTDALRASARLETRTTYGVTIKVGANTTTITAYSATKERSVEVLVMEVRDWVEIWHERSLVRTEAHLSSAAFVAAVDAASDQELRTWIEESL